MLMVHDARSMKCANPVQNVLRKAKFLKVELRRYFTLIIFREIAQRVHANPSNDNFRPHGKH